MTGLLMNHWYLAAWSEDLAESPVARTICNISMVLYRGSNGEVVALRDRCPHRFAPLSMGKIVGDEIACPYHGLRFDGSGSCTFNPFGDPPAQARVEAFPIAERDQMIWVWTGDPNQAAREDVPDYSDYMMPGLACIHQHFMLDGHIMLGVENLLDLTHATALHSTSFASGPYNDFLKSRHRAYFEDAELHACWDMHFDGGVNNAQTTWIAPGRMTISSTLDDKGRKLDPPWLQLHIYTPETETRTHYFTAERFDPQVESPKHMEERMRQFKELVFDREDNPVVAAIQKEMGDRDFFDMQPALLVTDKACVMARRRYQKMLREERGETE